MDVGQHWEYISYTTFPDPYSLLEHHLVSCFLSLAISIPVNTGFL